MNWSVASEAPLSTWLLTQETVHDSQGMKSSLSEVQSLPVQEPWLGNTLQTGKEDIFWVFPRQFPNCTALEGDISKALR